MPQVGDTSSTIMSQIKLEKCRAESSMQGLQARKKQVTTYEKLLAL